MLADKVQRQMKLENDAVHEGIKNYQKALREQGEAEMPPAMRLLKDGMLPLIRTLTEFKLGAKGGSTNAQVKKTLNDFKVSPDEVAFITLKHCFGWLLIDSSLLACAVALGKKIHAHHEYLKFKEEYPKYVKKVETDIASQDPHRKQAILMAMKRKKGVMDDVTPAKQLNDLGCKLIDLCIQTTGYFEITTHKSTHKLAPTAQTLEWLEEHHRVCELMVPPNYPMVIPPNPWVDVRTGGYLTLDARLVRQAYSQKKNRNIVVPERVLNIINTIQNVPWQINKRVFDIISTIWDEGSLLGDLPSQYPKAVPEKPWKTDAEFEILKESYPHIVKQWKWDASKVHDHNAKMKIKRLVVSTKLLIAGKFVDDDEIFFPHMMDWRGRIYPIPSYVNPQGDDLSKALLQFKRGVALGKDGAEWLMIHGANCGGVDKVSFEERIEWVKKHHEAILDSARNPLDGGRFWADMDDPFQFLAFCFEYEGFVREGESFISHLSVNMDGTCSGLQHFSALLLDSVGGREVNLLPSDKPQDVYRAVAEIVSKAVDLDAEEGDENALLWKGKIDRGIAKRNVMTLPYGAKQYGFKDQLMIELEKRGDGYLDTEDTFKPAVYLAKKMWDGIGEVVIAAREAMDWLQGVARVVSKLDKAISWTTPAGFTPVQQYVKRKEVKVNTFWGGVRVRLILLEETEQINSSKSANSISPNFVHSLDASHLMLTVESSHAKGLTDFSLIHDSFGTHAANVSLLNETLREQFVNQYSSDVLEQFRNDIINQLPEELHEEIPPVPAKGNLDLEQVKNSRYFFA